VDGAREGDGAGDRVGVLIVIDFLRSAKEDLRSLIRSLTMVIEDLRSLFTSFDSFERRLS
jgi:hypothetical protein